MRNQTPPPSPLRIDSHLHLWRLQGAGYGWLTPENERLYRDYLPDEAEFELSQNRIDGAVLVQADDTEADSLAMFDVASANPWVLGVVAWVHLDRPSEAERQLERWLQQSAFCGVRHLTHEDPRGDFLQLSSVRTTLKTIAQLGVPLDVPDAWPRDFAQVQTLAEELPELTIVLDHLGKPPRGSDSMSWRAALAELGRLPNVVAKVSGLRSAPEDYSVDSLAGIWDTALSAFGTQRLLWGSDWPVTGGYAPSLVILEELFSSLSPAEKAEVMGGNARRVYRI